MTEQERSWIIQLWLQIKVDRCHTFFTRGTRSRMLTQNMGFVHAHRVRILYENDPPTCAQVSQSLLHLEHFCAISCAKLICCEKKLVSSSHIFFKLNNQIQTNATVSRSCQKAPDFSHTFHRDAPMKGLSAKITFVSSFFLNAHIHSINLGSNSFIYLFRRPRYHSLLFSSLSNDYPAV